MMLRNLLRLIDRNFANFLTKGVDVVLKSDVLEKSVLKDSLQLLVNLKAELKRHTRVSHLAVIQARHDTLAGGNFSLKIFDRNKFLTYITSILLWQKILGYLQLVKTQTQWGRICILIWELRIRIACYLRN